MGTGDVYDGESTKMTSATQRYWNEEKGGDLSLEGLIQAYEKLKSEVDANLAKRGFKLVYDCKSDQIEYVLLLGHLTVNQFKEIIKEEAESANLDITLDENEEAESAFLNELRGNFCSLIENYGLKLSDYEPGNGLTKQRFDWQFLNRLFGFEQHKGLVVVRENARISTLPHEYLHVRDEAVSHFYDVW